MNSPIITPEANVAEQSRKQLQDKLNGLGGINGRRLSPEVQAQKLREACEGFESIFIQKMWQEMRNTVPKGGMMQGREERFWQDMYDQELSKSMTKAGGIGLADMMYEQLSRNLVSASRSAVGSPQASAFTPQAAPLIEENKTVIADISENHPQENNQTVMNSIYDGQAPQTAPAPEEEDDNQTRIQQQDHVLTASRAAIAQPAAEPAPQVVEPIVKERVEKPRKVETQRDNGLELAYLAKRAAGDKLGSHAVRPPLQKRNNHAAASVSADAAEVAQAQPGSAEALRAALDLANTGAPQTGTNQEISLNAMVASVKNKNAAYAAGAIQEAATSQVQMAEDAPQIRRIRKTTNIPKNKQSNKKDVIRMLNVDNTTHNSNAGRGLAAYQAAQANAPSQANSAAQVQNAESAQAAIKPLTAPEAAMAESPSFSIPPLKSSDLQS